MNKLKMTSVRPIVGDDARNFVTSSLREGTNFKGLTSGGRIPGAFFAIFPRVFLGRLRFKGTV